MLSTQAVGGIATLVLVGGLAVTGAAWLSNHRHVAARVIGRGVSVASAVFCGFVSFALVADNIGARPRGAGVIVTAVFAAIALASTLLAWRSFDRGRAPAQR